jgi:Na+:H+ antiporter, NhaA family
MVGPPSPPVRRQGLTMSDRPLLPSAPPEAWEPLLRLARLAARPLERFLRIQAASGILLLVAAAVALVWANSPWADSYTGLWHTPVGIRLGGHTFERSLEWVVNDGLMVIFFFVVGMEIRREVHHGELSELRRAALPAAAALGGMLVPAALYLVVAGGPATRAGWGVPMATDIAFAVGILTLLGKRVPAALRVLLLALAVIDDLGAIIVIALFYSPGISVVGLLIALAGFGLIFGLQRFGVRAKLVYVVPAVVAWAGIYAAGIHPTIAGVIVGLMTPVRVWTGREAASPAESLIESLHPWVAFGIMPIFALANAGVRISGGSLDSTSWTVLSAVAVGLMVGKPLGILAASWLALRLRIATLPVGMTVRHLIVLGVVSGVGFTMALFIAQLAFTDEKLLAAGKLGVLAASGGAAVLGLLMGRALLSPAKVAGAAETADAAECSTET